MTNAVRVVSGADIDAVERWENLMVQQTRPPAIAFSAASCRASQCDESGFLQLVTEADEAGGFVFDPARGLPFIADESMELVHSERAIETIPKATAQQLVSEFFRVLKPDGRIRIATLDLDYLVHRFNFDWSAQAWLDHSPWSTEVKTRGEMLNTALREFGNRFVYNQEDLSTLLKAAGFKRIVRYQAGRSAERRFWDLETSPESLLILEGAKE